MSELEKALEEIAEAAAEDTVENDTKKTDNAKAAEMRNRGSKKPEKNTEKANQKMEVTQLHIFVKKMITFRSGKKENCSCKSNELKLSVNRKINRENIIRIC